MLTIRDRQVRAFEGAQEIESAQSMRSYLVQTFPDLSRMNPGRLEIDTIRRSFSKAKGYGFYDDEQVGKFALLSFVLGEDFDLEPRNHFVLMEPLWHPAARLDYIIGWIEASTLKLTNSDR